VSIRNPLRVASLIDVTNNLPFKEVVLTARPAFLYGIHCIFIVP